MRLMTHVASGGASPSQPQFQKCWLHGRNIRKVFVLRLPLLGCESLGLPGVTWLDWVSVPHRQGACLSEWVTQRTKRAVPGEAQAARGGVGWPGSRVFERLLASSARPSVKQDEPPQPSPLQPESARVQGEGSGTVRADRAGAPAGSAPRVPALSEDEAPRRTVHGALAVGCVLAAAPRPVPAHSTRAFCGTPWDGAVPISYRVPGPPDTSCLRHLGSAAPQAFSPNVATSYH